MNPSDQHQQQYLTQLPSEIFFNIATFLRAYDLAALSLTCVRFQDAELTGNVIRCFATMVYPPELTEGYETAPPLFGERAGSKSLPEKVTAPRGRGSASSNGNLPERHREWRLKGDCLSPSSPCTTVSLMGISESSIPVVTSTAELRPRVTYERLRDMEMLVLLRALNRPEPPPAVRIVGHLLDGVDQVYSSDNDDQASRFYVSKSWCKAALNWLEVQEEARREQQSAAIYIGGHSNTKEKLTRTKKLSKKQQRLRNRRLSDASPPWSNVNHDLLCSHANLRRCNSKSARAKRRVIDRQAWKVLRKLYPESTALRCGTNNGSDECLLCLVEMETNKRAEKQEKERKSEQRKKPLADPLIRSFYVRGSRGVPQNRTVEKEGNVGSGLSGHGGGGGGEEKGIPVAIRMEINRVGTGLGTNYCPLLPGIYHAIPRSWCHHWRKYMKTGCEESARHACQPPDAAVLLCDAHKLPLIPPHLENYLRGETPSLLAVPLYTLSSRTAVPQGSDGPSGLMCTPRLENGMSELVIAGLDGSESTSSLAGAASVVFGNDVDLEHAIEGQRAALLSLGVNHGTQFHSEEAQAANCLMSSSVGSLARDPNFTGRNVALFSSLLDNMDATKNDLLDRENKVVVEILTDEEYTALEETCWPGLHGGSFTLKFAVIEGNDRGRDSSKTRRDGDASVSWCTSPCSECDAGHSSGDKVVVRNRSRAWVRHTHVSH